MVVASHVICTFYGFWLPNEERGSWSDFVRSWELLRFGNATKIEERRSVAHHQYNKQRKRQMQQALKYEPIELTGVQARGIARGFARAIQEGGYELPACSILPRHVHAVIMRHDRPVEQIAGHLKARATQQLRAEGLHPFEAFRDAGGRIPSVWTHRPWKVFLDSHDDIIRAIDYVRDNPLKEGKPVQDYPFLTEYPV